MALNDLYELVDKSIVGPQSVFNVYHFLRENAGVDASDIAEAYEDEMMASLLLLQDGRVDHNEITVRNLGDATDFAVRNPSPSVGTRTGQGFAQFYAATIQFNRLRTDMKNGQKRFMTGVELDQSDGLWNASFITEMEAIGTIMVGNWELASDPGVTIMNFVILKRFCVVPAQDPCLKYRLPDDDAEALIRYQPVGFIFRDRARSQVSRKRLQ